MAEVIAFDPSLHTGRPSTERCGQGGSDSCSRQPKFSHLDEKHRISACPIHLASAVPQADGVPPRR
jgi:hypothetical protein